MKIALWTANGGGIDAAHVIALEPEMRTFARWYIDAHMDSGAVFELDGEYSSRESAAKRVKDLLIRIQELETNDGTH